MKSSLHKYDRAFISLRPLSPDEQTAIHRLKVHLHRNSYDPFNSLVGLEVNPEFVSRCATYESAFPDPLTSVDIQQLLAELSLMASEKNVPQKRILDYAVSYSKRASHPPGSLFVIRLIEPRRASDMEKKDQIVYRFARALHLIDKNSCLVTIHPFEGRDSVFVVLTADIFVPPKAELDALNLDDIKAYDVITSPFNELKGIVSDVAFSDLIPYVVSIGNLDERVVRAAHQIFVFANSLKRKTKADLDDDCDEPFPSVGIPLFSLAPLIGNTFEMVSEVKRQCRLGDYRDLDGIAERCCNLLARWVDTPSPSWAHINTPLVREILAYYKDFNPPNISMASLPPGVSPPQCWRELLLKELDRIFKSALGYVNQNLAFILNGKQKRLFNESLLDQANQHSTNAHTKYSHIVF
jgi:hypothetical protein